jgi:hypothetical protein
MKNDLKKIGAYGILAIIGMGAVQQAYSNVEALMVRVAVLETKEKTQLELLNEVRNDVKIILQRTSK